MLKHTPLFLEHQKYHAVMTGFAGWEMPLHYGSQLEEHRSVREDAGIFDISHMGVIDIEGPDSQIFLQYLLANDVGKLSHPGKALYTCMLNHEGGVVDDLIVYYLAPNHYRLVVNAATLEKDFQWMHQHLTMKPSFTLSITKQNNYALLAVQGPQALKKAGQAFPQFQDKMNALKPFHCFVDTEFNQNDWMIARTGYTGEDGIEMMLPERLAEKAWEKLLKQNIACIGLGARDTLRLEAGYNLYGQDMDEEVSPLASNLGWTIAFMPKDREFIGRLALEEQKLKGVTEKLVGLILLEKGVLRHDQIVVDNNKRIGRVTSGSFSPTLKQSIALARIPTNIENECFVEIRGKYLKAKIIHPPFVRRSK